MRRGGVGNTPLAQAYAAAGRYSEAADTRLAIQGNLESRRSVEDAARIWHPLYAPLRKTERFKTLVRKADMVDFWRERGWPDLCRPMGADDFVCD